MTQEQIDSLISAIEGAHATDLTELTESMQLLHDDLQECKSEIQMTQGFVCILCGMCLAFFICQSVLRFFK